MPVAVHNPSVSQKTLSSAQRYNALEYHFAIPLGGGGPVGLYLYLHLNLSFRGHREILHQKAAAVSSLSLK